METQVRTPQMVFMQPQRLIVPLFQRPYVWNEDNQWEPLWADLLRVTQRLLDDPQGRHHPHFLGAVVLQQLQNTAGTMQERTIIDGQQRLTTLQLLLDALHAELLAAGAEAPAMRIETLVVNAEAFRERPEDRFKVWPTNRDRAAFNAVMAAEPPLVYARLDEKDSRLVRAHEYFATRAREWLEPDQENVPTRAAAIERAVRELIQMVVIDLAAEENAQEIFETLNARGAQLTAADLIKNFIFQRLSEAGDDVEVAYERDWKEFETGFWEAEISVGRTRQQRSSIFLNHWLIAKTGEEILAREVFHRFKTYADFDAGISMAKLLGQIQRAGRIYRDFIAAAGQLTGSIDRTGLFAYRTTVMESEVVKPFVLFLLDPDDTVISDAQVTKALQVVESWLVRRMLVRTTNKSNTQVIADLITSARKAGRETAGDSTEAYLANQSAAQSYWPDDAEVRKELASLPAYRRLSRGRLRMVLEAVEDHARGWRGSTSKFVEERAARGSYAIEHIMPRRWQTHWPLPEGDAVAERELLVDTIGNLTLLNGRLNSKVSNGPWDGPEGKREALHAQDVLMLNRHLLDYGANGWDDEQIRARTQRIIDNVLDVWPVPEGHRSGVERPVRRTMHKIELADLIGAGLLEAGTTLYARRQAFVGVTATVLPDGALDVGGVRHSTPTGAARSVYGKSVNGWWFWLIDPKSRLSLTDLWRQYVDQRGVDADDADVSDDDED
jgi:hypothetical protein